jgi:hypothetical protein
MVGRTDRFGRDRCPTDGSPNRRLEPHRHRVEDITALVAILKLEGVTFRNDIIKGPGGQQTLCEDPSGNPIEIFQPAS